MSYKKLGEFIQVVDDRNKELLDLPLLGVSVQKVFIPSIANTVGTDMSKYKILSRNQFTYIPDTSRRGDKIGVALFKTYDKALVSQAYTTFKIIDEDQLNPDYLMMWFTRPEFDRYARYHSIGSVREVFDWEDLCEVELPIPSIEKQREIVAQYQAVANKIKVNEQICEKLEATAQTLYKQWFVDFEFPCLPSGYRPHGQVNQNLPIDEYITKIGSVCTYSRVGGLPVSDGKTWFVYLILCENDSVYKGITNDLYRRFYEHYMGEGAEWTKLNKPLKVIHWESFATKEEAAKREKDLKTGYGRTWISRQIEKAGGITQLKTSLPAPQTELRTAGKMVFNLELEKEIPEGWKVGTLDDIIYYSETKISLKNLTTEDYVSTESMLPDKKGVDFISNVPEGNNVTSFEKGDILISNIRPYLKKIWFADKKGGCSNDVLCIRSKDIVYQFFALNILFNDQFFDYVMQGAKGTKMPRGDKKWILEYKIILPKKEILSKFSKDIELVNQVKIANTLQNQKLTQLQSLLLSRLATLEG